MKLAALLGNDTLKQRLSALQAKGKLTHSFLLTGPEGSGRHTLARILCAAMQCTAPGERPCGVCQQCRKVLDGAHPDICIVDDPEKKTIPVKLVRDACTDLYIRPNEGQRKIYLFPRAQDLNQQGQNVLLKSIEEPPPYGTFLLLAEHAEQLLPTIRSRCVELRLSPLPEAVLLPALRERFPDVPEGTLRAAGVRAGRRRAAAAECRVCPCLLRAASGGAAAGARPDGAAEARAAPPHPDAVAGPSRLCPDLAQRAAAPAARVRADRGSTPRLGYHAGDRGDPACAARSGGQCQPRCDLRRADRKAAVNAVFADCQKPAGPKALEGLF